MELYEFVGVLWKGKAMIDNVIALVFL